MKSFQEFFTEGTNPLYFIYSNEFSGNATNTSTRDLDSVDEYAKSKNLTNYVVIEYKNDVYSFVKVGGNPTEFIKKMVSETEKEVNEYKTDMEQLNAGKIKPASIIGRGSYTNPKKAALEWLSKQIKSKESFLNSFKAAQKIKIYPKRMGY